MNLIPVLVPIATHSGIFANARSGLGVQSLPCEWFAKPCFYLVFVLVKLIEDCLVLCSLRSTDVKLHTAVMLAHDEIESHSAYARTSGDPRITAWRDGRKERRASQRFLQE